MHRTAQGHDVRMRVGEYSRILASSRWVRELNKVMSVYEVPVSLVFAVRSVISFVPVVDLVILAGVNQLVQIRRGQLKISELRMY